MKDWSTFGEDVTRHRRARGPRCGVTLMLEELPPEARGPVGRVLADRGITNSAIHKALRERLGDKAPSLFSVANHRRGSCRCEADEQQVAV